MKPGIILAVTDAQRRQAYLALLDATADYTLTESLREIPELLRQGPFKGILIDIQLNVRAGHMDRVRVSDSLDAMPSATLNIDARSGSVRLLMLNKTHGMARTVEEFVELCGTFQPKVIYPHDQGGLHLNAVISGSPSFEGDAEHTFTMQVSGGGCFLFTANRTSYQPNDTVWIDFVGLADRHPIQAKVCWKCPWGVSHTVPGIYVSFESILKVQHEEIKALIAGKRF